MPRFQRWVVRRVWPYHNFSLSVARNPARTSVPRGEIEALPPNVQRRCRSKINRISSLFVVLEGARSGPD